MYRPILSERIELAKPKPRPVLWVAMYESTYGENDFLYFICENKYEIAKAKFHDEYRNMTERNTEDDGVHLLGLYPITEYGKYKIKIESKF